MGSDMNSCRIMMPDEDVMCGLYLIADDKGY